MIELIVKMLIFWAVVLSLVLVKALIDDYIDRW